MNYGKPPSVDLMMNPMSRGRERIRDNFNERFIRYQKRQIGEAKACGERRADGDVDSILTCQAILN